MFCSFFFFAHECLAECEEEGVIYFRMLRSKRRFLLKGYSHSGCFSGRGGRDISDRRYQQNSLPDFGIHTNAVEPRGMSMLSDTFSGCIHGKRARCPLTKEKKNGNGHKTATRDYDSCAV